MSFQELEFNPIVVRGLERQGFVEPTAIQAQTASPILEGRDVIGLAPTGTGKTLAYLTPVADRLLAHRPPRKPVTARLRGLVLTPTRELAIQVAQEAEELTKGSVLRVLPIYGGVSANPQADRVAGGVDLVIATPGRVLELLSDGLISFAYLRHLVIDEADKLFDMGFLPQVDDIASRMSREVQRLLFSASMPAPVEALANERLRKPIRIEVGTHTRAAEHVEQHLMPCADHLKTRLVLQLLDEPAGDGSTEKRSGVLIFARTKRRVGWIAAALGRHGVDVGILHGDKSQAQRLRALDQFAKGERRAIVATDVAARGLHVPAVKTVINYDLPAAPEEFVHRVGRAGHGGGFGEAFTLLDDRDDDDWQKIVEITETKLRPEFRKDFDYDEAPKRGRTREAEDDFDPDRDTRRAPRTKDSKDGKKKKRYRAAKTMVKRGRIKSRGGAKRPGATKEKPGTGVRKTTRDRKPGSQDQ